jgi:hypothetical protein
MNGISLKELTESYDNMVNATLKLSKVYGQENQSPALADTSKEKLKKHYDLVEKIFEKIEEKVAAIDIAAEPEPVKTVTAQVQPEQQTAQVQPEQQQVVQNTHQKETRVGTGEELFAGKTLRELSGMNSAPLFKLASDISRANPNVNPNVPLQGQMYEANWREALIVYITSNAQFVQGMSF